MPDNGLANLAGELVCAGHHVEILDFGTTSSMRRLFPAALGERLRPLFARILSGEAKPRWTERVTILRMAKALERAQRREMARIAQEVAVRVQRTGVDMVGLKVWNGDGLTGSIQIGRAIKSRSPRVKVFAGGPHCDWFGPRILEYAGCFDALCSGEGEATIVPLAEYVDGKAGLPDVRGMTWLENGQVRSTRPVHIEDLDAIAPPAYSRDIYPAVHSGKQIKIVTIDETRGCPGRCNFCIHPTKSGSKWRFKSPQRILQEMVNVQRQLGTRLFIYAGSNTPWANAREHARTILSAGLDVRYVMFGHINGMHNADFDLLKRSGCRAIFFGVESGSQRMLNQAYRKGTKVDNIRKVLCAAREAGLFAIASIIYPGPGDDDESRRATLQLLRDTRPDSVPVQFAGLVPGSRWAQEPERFGFRLRKGRKFWKEAMTYKIKLLFPPRYWRPLPYRIDGMKWRIMVAETEGMIEDIEKMGLVTGMGHDLVLMADTLGMSARDFRDRVRLAFLTGDVDVVEDLVSKINRAAQPPASDAMCGDRASASMAEAGQIRA